VGVGETLDKLEPFYPDRMASRILGMGDVVTLVEKAQEQMDEGTSAELYKKMLTGAVRNPGAERTLWAQSREKRGLIDGSTQGLSISTTS
jgi:hypothetical protein